MKNFRKLTLELKLDSSSEPNEPQGSRAQLDSPCMLKNPRDCCGGRGYRWVPKGAFAAAELCFCVKECPSCFGRARRLENGFAVPCKTPSPLKICNLVEDAQLPARYTNANLANFANQTGNGHDVIRYFEEKWLKNFKPGEKGVILGGPVGVGKTFVLSAIAKSLLGRGISVRFADFFHLISQIKGAYQADESAEALIQPLMDVDVLIVDELGKGHQTPFERATIDQLVMGRYNQGKTIIGSTNAILHKSNHQVNLMESKTSFDDYGALEERIGERAYSRLTETCLFIEMKGSDFRYQRKPSL